MFTGFDASQYEDEARERWGDTEAYSEAASRTAAYGAEEWRRIKAETEEIQELFAELKRTGEPTDGERARAAAERAPAGRASQGDRVLVRLGPDELSSPAAL